MKGNAGFQELIIMLFDLCQAFKAKFITSCALLPSNNQPVPTSPAEEPGSRNEMLFGPCSLVMAGCRSDTVQNPSSWKSSPGPLFTACRWTSSEWTMYTNTWAWRSSQSMTHLSPSPNRVRCLRNLALFLVKPGNLLLAL